MDKNVRFLPSPVVRKTLENKNLHCVKLCTRKDILRTEFLVLPEIALLSSKSY